MRGRGRCRGRGREGGRGRKGSKRGRERGGVEKDRKKSVVAKETEGGRRGMSNGLLPPDSPLPFNWM